MFLTNWTYLLIYHILFKFKKVKETQKKKKNIDFLQ